jgi:hypothetical protein
VIIISDIYKCSEAKDCVHRDVCYRSTASDGMIQSYSYFMTEGKCDFENGYPYLWIRNRVDRKEFEDEQRD